MRRSCCCTRWSGTVDIRTPFLSFAPFRTVVGDSRISPVSSIQSAIASRDGNGNATMKRKALVMRLSMCYLILNLIMLLLWLWL